MWSLTDFTQFSTQRNSVSRDDRPFAAQSVHDRRRFLCFSAGTTSVAAAALLGRCGLTHWFPASHSGPLPWDRRSGQIATFSRTSWALGSPVTLTLLDRDARQAERAMAAAFDELETIEQLMSVYRADSELSELNRGGRLVDPHPYLLEVLRMAEWMSCRSGGAFDVTVQPLWRLNQEAKQRGELPTEDEVAIARRDVDWKRVKVSPSRVDLRGAATSVTLNGIAQGFAADRVRAVLAAHGITAALIDTGELSSMGSKSDGRPWRVGIQHPRRSDAYIGLARLAGRCLATSGDYATSFTVDRREHHVFDPTTGRSPHELCSVSVVAPTAVLADAMSTAVLVTGIERGLRLVESTSGVDALMVDKHGRTVVTDGFPIARQIRNDEPIPG